MKLKVRLWLLSVLFFSLQLSPINYQTKIDQLMAEAEYGKASLLIYKHLSSGSLLSMKEKAKLFWSLGVCKVSFGKLDAAKSAFFQVLINDLSFSPQPLVSPKIEAVFHEVRQFLIKSGASNDLFKPKLHITDTHMSDKPLCLSLTLNTLLQPGFVAQASFLMRLDGETFYRSFPMLQPLGRGHPYFLCVDMRFFPKREQDYAVEYYVKIHDYMDKSQIKVGSFRKPQILRVTHESDPFWLHDSKNDLETSSFWKRNWPLFVGAGLAIGGALLFGALNFSKAKNPATYTNTF